MKTRVAPLGDFLFMEKPLIDVRSPSEFARGHIPGAINIPLLDDEMRRRVGITYAQRGRQEAVREGFRVTARWLPELSHQLGKWSGYGGLRVYCWRGGMRSESMAFLAGMLGISSVVLEGGYKAFRRQAHAYFEKKWRLVVLGGMTGSGKSLLLRQLKHIGYQVLDLEALASHKGSVFGHIGQDPQPTTEQFENLVFDQLLHFDPMQPVWVEDESITVGRCFIPRLFFDQMQKAPLILINVDQDTRANRLAEEYGQHGPEELLASVDKLSRRLGLERAARIKALIGKGELREAAASLLDYYDKAYNLCISRRDKSFVHVVEGWPDVSSLGAMGLQVLAEGLRGPEE
ncbi:MAG: tRNA 2-selenouridine(34) synthase MnmH [Bacteroidales bacterium]